MVQLDRIYTLSNLAIKLTYWLGFIPVINLHLLGLVDRIGKHKERKKESLDFQLQSGRGDAKAPMKGTSTASSITRDSCIGCHI